MIGVLLAAGRGRRMGGTKQLLRWPDAAGSRTLVEASFDAIAPFCRAMIVVLGHEADAVAAALGEREFIAVPSDPDAEMIDSAKAGLRAAARLDASADVLLHPADHPSVSPSTVEMMLGSRREHPGRALMPEHGGRGGHPVLIPFSLIESILSFAGAGGLRQFWQDEPRRCVRLPVDDAGVVRDLDEPGDYGEGMHRGGAEGAEERMG